jgi:hypothetical protein
MLGTVQRIADAMTVAVAMSRQSTGRGIISAITAVMGETYAEPFFGGGSICLALINRNSVCSVVINDADLRVVSVAAL